MEKKKFYRYWSRRFEWLIYGLTVSLCDCCANGLSLARERIIASLAITIPTILTNSASFCCSLSFFVYGQAS